MNWAAPRRLAVALTLAATLVAAGCSGEESGPAAEPSESLIEPSDAPTLRVEPVTSSGTIVGRLPRSERHRVERAISALTVKWLDAAYLGGKYPRRDFRKAYPGFTRGAAEVAHRDRMLLTNRRLGPRVDEVTPTSVRVRVDLLAVEKRTVSATAHFETRFKTTGKIRRRVRVAGRLLLTKPHGQWKIFGYDVSKGVR